MESRQELPSFSEVEIKKVMGSKEGRELLRLLQRSGGDALRRAAEAVKSGDWERAKKIMQPVAESPEAAALIDQINRK